MYIKSARNDTFSLPRLYTTVKTSLTPLIQSEPASSTFSGLSAYFCCWKLQIHSKRLEHFVCDCTGKKREYTGNIPSLTHTHTHTIQGGQLSLQDVESANGTQVRGLVACLCTLDGRRVPSLRGNKISKNKWGRKKALKSLLIGINCQWRHGQK